MLRPTLYGSEARDGQTAAVGTLQVSRDIRKSVVFPERYVITTPHKCKRLSPAPQQRKLLIGNCRAIEVDILRCYGPASTSQPHLESRLEVVKSNIKYEREKLHIYSCLHKANNQIQSELTPPFSFTLRYVSRLVAMFSLKYLKPA